MLLAPIERPEQADVRRIARSLFWRGWGISQLTEELNALGYRNGGKLLRRATVESWKQREKWAEAPSVRRAEEEVAARYCQLIAKEKKTGHDFKEIDLLGRQLERLERCRKYRDSGNEADLNPNVANRNAEPKKKPRRNHLTDEQIEDLRTAFFAWCFDYQRFWWENRNHKTRFILKSRQIGATNYFALEALIDALETGRNQIFISASQRQANVFRSYIIEFVFRVTGVQLKGKHLQLDRGEDEDGQPRERPTLFFLGANHRTAQSEHGNFYYDECFWAQDFERTDELASGMASQARYRETYFSTPSTVTHEAYRKWSGEKFNEGRPQKDWTKIDTYYEALRGGSMGEDYIWRQIVTLEDAIAGGCDLFDIEDLRRRKSPEEFDNKYLCKFVDDSQSAFPLAFMQRCRVDSFEKWSDFDAYSLRPYGEGEVALGYDPQESAQGDDAALVAIALPVGPKGRFRVLEKKRLRGDFKVQAAEIFKFMERYNVVDIGIDISGVGAAVYQLVTPKFPMARGIRYSAGVKTMMVFKTKNVIRAGRLEYDAADHDITDSFMSIRPEMTPKSGQMTFVASRSDKTGHADVAWAVMHVLFNEPLDEESGAQKSSVEIM